jgi:hypothetical protein
MKYLCLIYIDEDKLEDTLPDDCMAYAATLKEQGQCLAAEALDCLPLTSVRVRDGKVSTSDGPFVETKEFLAGIYLLEVADRDEAVLLMSRNPCAPAGRMELRPIMDVRF